MNKDEEYMNGVFEKVEKKDMQVIEEKANELKGFVWEIILTVLFALMTLFILGIYELFSSEWDWSIYQSSEFWTRYGLLQGASWFARIWIYVIRVKHHERNDKTYLSLEDDLQEFVNADFETPFIETDANADNFNRKKRAWINKRKLKLIKFANKYQITNIIPAVKDVNNTEITMHGFQLKSDKKMRNSTEKRINRKITFILKTIRDDWCEQNIETLTSNKWKRFSKYYIEYNKVSRTILTSGYVSNRSGDNSPNYKRNGAKVFISSTVPAFLFVSAFMFLIVPLTGDIDKSADAWFKFITNFMMVLGSGAMMWYNSLELFKQTSLKAMFERVGTINGYAKKRGIKIKREVNK